MVAPPEFRVLAKNIEQFTPKFIRIGDLDEAGLYSGTILFSQAVVGIIGSASLDVLFGDTF